MATGPFQVPFVPPIAERLADEIVQLHATAYRSPRDLPEGPVLVVGGGNTGFQIATELSASRQTHLSIGGQQKPLPQQILGRDLFWYLDKTGLIRTSRNTRIGRRIQGQETLVGASPRRLTKRYGVRLHPRTVDACARAVRFSDQSELDVAGVIWATGFRPDHAWIHAPVFGGDGRVVHTRGVTAAAGLYFLGLSWQYSRGSALIGFVADDAAHLADAITRYRSSLPGSRRSEPVGVA